MAEALTMNPRRYAVDSSHPRKLAQHYLDCCHRDEQGRLTLRRKWGNWYRCGSYVPVEDEVVARSIRRWLDDTSLRTVDPEAGAESFSPIPATPELAHAVLRELPMLGTLVTSHAPLWPEDRWKPSREFPRDCVLSVRGASECATGSLLR